MSDDWFDSGDYELPDGAEGDWRAGDDNPATPSELASLALQSLGLSDYEGQEIYVDIDAVEDLSELRGVRFESIADAVFWLFETGLLSIGGMVVGIDDDEYTVSIPSDTGGTG